MICDHRVQGYKHGWRDSIFIMRTIIENPEMTPEEVYTRLRKNRIGYIPFCSLYDVYRIKRFLADGMRNSL